MSGTDDDDDGQTGDYQKNAYYLASSNSPHLIITQVQFK